MSGFQVKRLSKTVVVAAAPPPEHRLPQSNLDLLMVKVHMSIFFCYQKPSGAGYTFESSVNVLKEALSKTLVPYYPLAGEMVVNAAGEPELLCNNRGVDFVEAYADVELRELNFYKPDESIHGKLVPTIDDGVWAVQITQLSCGGVVVGCTLDHRVSDAYSASMFWKSWVEMAKSKPLSCIPSFNRSIISPRHPTKFDSSITDAYVPISQVQPPETTLPTTMMSRIYSISAEQIHNLQELANHENPSSLIRKRTKLEALSAFLWKLTAGETTTSRDSFCHLGISVNGRIRIAADGAMDNYFGNVVASSFGKRKTKELEEMPLSSTANEIHKCLDVVVRKDHFLGLIDYVQAHRPEPVASKFFFAGPPSMWVSSGRGFSGREMDFGWGVPVFGSHLPPPGPTLCGMAITMPDLCENGDWIVYTCLPQNQIELIENNFAHMVKPFTLA